jgi:putative transposase
VGVAAALSRMARKPREELAGGVFHVYARGVDKRSIFRDDADRVRYLRGLAGVVGKRRWQLMAFCLMQNHVHLLVETPEPNLAAGMCQLHGDYVRYFNRRYNRSGHLFQGRYGAERVKTDEQLWVTAAYVAANPVRAGLCESAEQWPWGSHAAIVPGDAPGWLDAGRLLGYFAAAGGDGRARYVEMVRNAGSPAGAGLPEEGTAGGARGAASR